MCEYGSYWMTPCARKICKHLAVAQVLQRPKQQKRPQVLAQGTTRDGHFLQQDRADRQQRPVTRSEENERDEVGQREQTKKVKMGMSTVPLASSSDPNASTYQETVC
jgi:hypothetical protein